MKIQSELKFNRDFQIVVVAIAFYASASLGHFLAFPGSSILPTWPPSGVAFALILTLGRQAWPGVTIGSLVTSLMSQWAAADVTAHALIAVCSFTAIAHTLEALIGEWLVRNWIRDDYPFKTSRAAFQFLFVTIIMCFSGAAISAFVLYSTNVISQDDLLKTGISWLIGNTVGILLFTPLILSLVRNNVLKFSAEKALEIGIFLLGALGIIFILQVDYFSATIQRALPFLILPFFSVAGVSV